MKLSIQKSLKTFIIKCSIKLINIKSTNTFSIKNGKSTKQGGHNVYIVMLKVGFDILGGWSNVNRPLLIQIITEWKMKLEPMNQLKVIYIKLKENHVGWKQNYKIIFKKKNENKIKIKKYLNKKKIVDKKKLFFVLTQFLNVTL